MIRELCTLALDSPAIWTRLAPLVMLSGADLATAQAVAQVNRCRH